MAGVGFFGLGGGFGFGLGGGSLFVGWGCELEPVDVVEVDAVEECVEIRVVGFFGLLLFFGGRGGFGFGLGSGLLLFFRGGG